MNIETLREYCISKPCVEECFPFDETTLVFKVMGKMFLLTDLISEFSITVKCDPEMAVDLRERYPFVTPGYHFNKKYWNTVYINELVPDKLLCKWIDHSYNEVIRGFSGKKIKELNEKSKNE
jgi:predicted DNA-binding protein (MmcQ/YjbR family)